MKEKKHQRKAIIIGAGPAGLTAAYQLLKETDIKPIILEETNYIGGISRTAIYKGNRIDIGGHRFFSKSKEVTDLWNEIMPLQGKSSKDDKKLGIKKPLVKDGPDPEKVDRVMLIRNRISRIFFLRKFFDYPISMKLQTFKNMGLIRTMKAGFGYILSVINKRKENSLEDFFINRFGKPLYAMFFEDYTEKLWGVHPRNISPSWGAQRIKGLSLMQAVKEVLLKIFKKDYQSKETSLIEQFFYPKKGPGQLWETMAEEIRKMGGEIHLDSSVTKINCVGNKISGVESRNVKGNITSTNGDFFFSSMPIKDLVDAMGDDIPKDVKKIATNLPYRSFITVGLLLKKLKIKNETNIKTVGNIVPDTWIYIQERDVKIGRLQIFNNWSPYMVQDNENTVWVGLEYFCDEGDEMWNTPEKEFIRFAIRELVKIDVIEEQDVLDSTYIRMKKVYPAYFGTYEEFDKVKDYLNTIDNLYCIGRNGQHRYNNTDHSMLTAIETVKVIKNNLKDKSVIWNVNTEEEYHEERKSS